MDSLHLLLTANQQRERYWEGMCDKLGCVTWRWLRKDDDVVLHRQSLSSCPGDGLDSLLQIVPGALNIQFSDVQ